MFTLAAKPTSSVYKYQVNELFKNVLFSLSVFSSLLFIQLNANADTATGNEALWDALRSSNHFALIRHALAPGTGDPSDFTIGERKTQRNLSEQGREQARRIGELFRTQGIKEARIFSSEWYRCRDTAELLSLGPVTTLPALNSFFQDHSKQDAIMASLRIWLARQTMDKPFILVTHQVNITALTGVYPSSGEIVVARKNGQGDLHILGSIETL
jgi:phosphohistidine phosphatase SixA